MLSDYHHQRSSRSSDQPVPSTEENNTFNSSFEDLIANLDASWSPDLNDPETWGFLTYPAIQNT